MTPTSSNAVAVRLVVPETGAPSAGPVSETLGAVVSAAVVAFTTGGLGRVVSRRVERADCVAVGG